jgi:hypothetical protein
MSSHVVREFLEYRGDFICKFIMRVAHCFHELFGIVVWVLLKVESIRLDLVIFQEPLWSAQLSYCPRCKSPMLILVLASSTACFLYSLLTCVALFGFCFSHQIPPAITLLLKGFLASNRCFHNTRIWHPTLYRSVSERICYSCYNCYLGGSIPLNGIERLWMWLSNSV